MRRKQNMTGNDRQRSIAACLTFRSVKSRSPELPCSSLYNRYEMNYTVHTCPCWANSHYIKHWSHTVRTLQKSWFLAKMITFERDRPTTWKIFIFDWVRSLWTWKSCWDPDYPIIISYRTVPLKPPDPTSKKRFLYLGRVTHRLRSYEICWSIYLIDEQGTKKFCHSLIRPSLFISFLRKLIVIIRINSFFLSSPLWSWKAPLK